MDLVLKNALDTSFSMDNYRDSENFDLIAWREEFICRHYFAAERMLPVSQNYRSETSEILGTYFKQPLKRADRFDVFDHGRRLLKGYKNVEEFYSTIKGTTEGKFTPIREFDSWDYLTASNALLSMPDPIEFLHEDIYQIATKTSEWLLVQTFPEMLSVRRAIGLHENLSIVKDDMKEVWRKNFPGAKPTENSDPPPSLSFDKHKFTPQHHKPLEANLKVDLVMSDEVLKSQFSDWLTEKRDLLEKNNELPSIKSTSFGDADIRRWIKNKTLACIDIINAASYLGVDITDATLAYYLFEKESSQGIHRDFVEVVRKTVKKEAARMQNSIILSSLFLHTKL